MIEGVTSVSVVLDGYMRVVRLFEAVKDLDTL